MIASSAPSANTGSGRTASASSPAATMRPWTWLRMVRAQTEVPAIAALTAKPCARQRSAHRLHQRCFAAEQMGAAGDVEKQTMRRIERDQRREAVAPVGDVVQCLEIGGRIGVEHLHMRADRARIGQRQADLEPETAPRHRPAHRSAARCFAWRRRCWRHRQASAAVPSPLVGEGSGRGVSRHTLGLVPLHPLPRRSPHKGKGSRSSASQRALLV